MTVCAAVVLAQQQEETRRITKEEFEKGLAYQTGKVELPGGMASLLLGPDFRFLAKADTRRVLEDALGQSAR
jgi:hypothetical protein